MRSKEVRTITLTPKTIKLYDRIANEVIVELESSTVSTGMVITKMVKLAQVCGGSIIDDDKGIITVGKEKVNETLSIMEQNPGSTIIWCQFTHEIEILKAVLRKKKYKVGVFSGKTLKTRDQAKRDFQAEKIDVIIVQNDTGEMGITLTAAQTVIFFSNSRSYKTRKQSIDRCGKRISQKKLVSYFDIQSGPRFMDTIIYKSLVRKKGLSDQVLTSMVHSEKGRADLIRMIRGEE